MPKITQQRVGGGESIWIHAVCPLLGCLCIKAACSPSKYKREIKSRRLYRGQPGACLEPWTAPALRALRLTPASTKGHLGHVRPCILVSYSPASRLATLHIHLTHLRPPTRSSSRPSLKSRNRHLNSSQRPARWEQAFLLLRWGTESHGGTEPSAPLSRPLSSFLLAHPLWKAGHGVLVAHAEQ